MPAISDEANQDLDVVTSQAMVRHQKVADRTGALVTERVKGLIEAAQARAEIVERGALEEAERIDRQRQETASRVASEMEALQRALARLRRDLQSDYTIEGTFVEEDRLIEAAGAEEPTGPGAESEPDAAVDVEEPAAHEEREVEEAEVETRTEEPGGAEAGEADPTAADTGVEREGSHDEDDAQRTRFSFLRRRERQEGSAAAAEPMSQESGGEHDQFTHRCAVCGRGFAGEEDELKSLGWLISESGDVTCADCHSAGWLQPSG